MDSSMPREWLDSGESRNGSKPHSPEWPELGEAALYGLPGKVVKLIEPHTEADSAALLANLLAAAGNVIGRGAYMQVGADRHHLNLNVVLVGETAKGRKGSSWNFIRDLFHAVDAPWAEDRVLNGLSSGEGLMFAVRDKVLAEKDGDLQVVDAGVADKRLLVVESEFASVLKVATREGNTLSPTLRSAWDGSKLASMTKNSPLKATDAHISLIGHVTRSELLRNLSSTDTEAGFSNRFLFLMVKRSKQLPFGGDWSSVDTAPVVRLLSTAVQSARSAGEVTFGESARDLWRDVYGGLSEGKPGLFGAATGRAEAQAIRLAALYAVLDGSATIERDHLEAALALWKYAEDSARYIFGDSTGDAVADRIMDALAEEQDGMSRSDLMNLFGRHKSGEQIGQALTLLESLGRIRREKSPTSGRPVERFYAV